VQWLVGFGESSRKLDLSCECEEKGYFGYLIIIMGAIRKEEDEEKVNNCCY
jgi:hypothetical protein